MSLWLIIIWKRLPFQKRSSIRTHDQGKEQQTVSIDLIWSVAWFCACDVWGTKIHDGAKLGCGCGCGQASYASGHNIQISGSQCGASCLRHETVNSKGKRNNFSLTSLWPQLTRIVPDLSGSSPSRALSRVSISTRNIKKTESAPVGYNSWCQGKCHTYLPSV
jgi:hypothetical protein